MRPLKLGSTGRDVKAWPDFLVGQNRASGTADGFLGANTRNATSIFQTQHGLTPDRLAGRGTLAAAAGKGFVVPPEEQIGGALAANDDFVAEIAGVSIFETESGDAIYYTAGLAIDADGVYRAYNARQTLRVRVPLLRIKCGVPESREGAHARKRSFPESLEGSLTYKRGLPESREGVLAHNRGIPEFPDGFLACKRGIPESPERPFFDANPQLRSRLRNRGTPAAALPFAHALSGLPAAHFHA